MQRPLEIHGGPAGAAAPVRTPADSGSVGGAVTRAGFARAGAAACPCYSPGPAPRLEGYDSPELRKPDASRRPSGGRWRTLGIIAVWRAYSDADFPASGD